MDPDARPDLLRPLHQSAGADPDIFLFEDQGQVLAKLPVQHGQQPVQPLQHGDLTAQVREEAGKFNADDAAADDDQGAVEVVGPLQQLLAGEDAGELHAGQGQADGLGPRGSEDGLRRDFRLPFGPGDAHPVGFQDLRPAPEQRDLRAFEHALHAGAEGLGHPELILEDLAQIRPQALGVDAHGGPLPGGAVKLGAVQQGLGGDAAPVHAGTAGLPGLHNRNLFAQLRRPQGSSLASRPGADHKKIKIEHGCFLPNTALGLKLPG